MLSSVDSKFRQRFIQSNLHIIANIRHNDLSEYESRGQIILSVIFKVQGVTKTKALNLFINRCCYTSSNGMFVRKLLRELNT